VALLSVRSLLDWSTTLHHFGGTSGLAAALLAVILVALLFVTSDNTTHLFDLVSAYGLAWLLDVLLGALVLDCDLGNLVTNCLVGGAALSLVGGAALSLVGGAALSLVGVGAAGLVLSLLHCVVFDATSTSIVLISSIVIFLLFASLLLFSHLVLLSSLLVVGTGHSSNQKNTDLGVR